MPRSVGKRSEQRGRHARAARTQNRDVDFNDAWSQTFMKSEADLAERDSEEEGSSADGDAPVQVIISTRNGMKLLKVRAVAKRIDEIHRSDYV